jgi:hypothetical protein
VTRNSNDVLVGANAVTVESLVIALLSPIVWSTSTYWKYDFVFLIAVAIIIILMLIRVMAAKADNPNIFLIRRSLGLSSRLLDLVLIGALAATSNYIISLLEISSPIAVFAVVSSAATVGFVLLDQLVLGEYAGTWNKIIHTETENNRIGHLLRDIGDLGENKLTQLGDDESSRENRENSQIIIPAIKLVLLLLVVFAPVWLILSILFENWQTGIILMFSLLFLRDTTRYLYIGYGAASNLSDFSWPLKWEFVWSIAKGIIIASTLGYEISTTI